MAQARLLHAKVITRKLCMSMGKQSHNSTPASQHIPTDRRNPFKSSPTHTQPTSVSWPTPAPPKGESVPWIPSLHRKMREEKRGSPLLCSLGNPLSCFRTCPALAGNVAEPLSRQLQGSSVSTLLLASQTRLSLQSRRTGV